jgi:hypothetical protein
VEAAGPISDLAAGGGFTGEKVMEINKKFDTDFR